jgi:hypothetical protein
MWYNIIKNQQYVVLILYKGVLIMNRNIEKEIYNLRSVLNRMVSKDVNLTDDNVVRLSVELDNLLNIFHSTKVNTIAHQKI